MAPASAEMRPPHEDFELKQEIAWCPDEKIVISGMSGRFPDTSTVEDFKHKLFDGADFLTQDDKRYPAGTFNLPKRAGRIKEEDISKFDATFFGINSKQADQMDPQMRLLVETTHEAILDAGINPLMLRGTRTGVFIAASSQEALIYWTDLEERVHGYGMLGGSLSMFSNRVSFTFDFKGPSYTVDTSCAGGLFVLQQAITAIHTGICEYAVVGASNTISAPTRTLQWQKLKLLTPDGIGKPFDAAADGFVRSEAVVTLFLQKEKSAKRVYATVLGGVGNYGGFHPDGPTNVVYESQLLNINELLTNSYVKPNDVVYVEANALGTLAGDSAEMNAFAEVLCKNRKSPLLVGSLKSSIGDAEAASGLCSVVKVLLAMEAGFIPPTLNYKYPNPYISALHNSKMKVVDKTLPLKDGVVVVNGIGIAGSNAMVLLQNTQKSKTIIEDNKKKFRLVCVSGRTEHHVESILNKVANYREDEEFLTMINDLYSKSILGYDIGGYTVLTDKITAEIQVSESTDRPIWFVFAGMGSQWAGMARDILKIPICEKVIRKLDAFLSRDGYNLLAALTSNDESTYDNILNSLCCIAAIQIALVDLLYSIGIHPDGMVGHSAGEVGCAYADGTLTAEETLLTAYYRGRSLLESNLSVGSMAAVGMSWEETKKRVPDGIFAACHNSADSVTISGPPERMKSFVAKLKSEGIFAREVKSSGFAFHSKYVTNAGSLYRKYLEQAIKNPKQRTKRWISTCIPESEWHSEKAQFSSPDYHVTNLICPVLFQEGLEHIPDNAIIIEIAPHHLMQAILKRALGKNTTVLGLLKRQHENNLEYLLSNIGKAYIAGVRPNLNALLSTTVQYPVSRGTPMINSMIEWEHSSDWTVPLFPEIISPKMNVCDFNIDLTSDEFSYINGHHVDGRIVMPGVGYVWLAWKAFALMNKKDFTEFPIVFDNLQFMRATIIPEEGSITLSVNYLPATSQIEISEGSATVMRAYVRPGRSFDEETYQYPDYNDLHKTVLIDEKSEIYKLLFLIGFFYKPPFLGIKRLCVLGHNSQLEWNDSYIGFMDTMIQAMFYIIKLQSLHLPMGFTKLTIDPFKQREIVSKLAPGEGIDVHYNDVGFEVKCGGVEMRNLQFSLAPQKANVQFPLFEKYAFIPYLSNEIQELSPIQVLRLFTQLVIENNPQVFELKALEYGDNRVPETLYSSDIIIFIESVPLLKLEADVTLLKDDVEQLDPSFAQNGVKIKNTSIIKTASDGNYQLIVAQNVITNHELMDAFVNNLLPGGFIMLQEPVGTSPNNFNKFGLQLISNIETKDFVFLFFRKLNTPTKRIYIHIDESYQWLEKVKSAIKYTKDTGEKILLIGEQIPNLGILGLVNCLKREPESKNIQCVFVLDSSAPKFSEKVPFYMQQLAYDLVMNVFKNGKWGSYRHITIPSPKDNKIITPYAYVNTTTKGDLSTTQWIQDAPPHFSESEYRNKKLCYVYYTPISDADIQNITLKSSKYILDNGLRYREEYIGNEFSGVDTDGKRVMGLISDKALATMVFADDHFLWEVPEDWSLEQSSTIPLPYITAYYALSIRTQIHPGESVLIHNVQTPVGQAALAVCRKAGCKIYLTGTSVALIYSRSLYLELSEDCMTDMTKIPIDYMIMKATNRKGVDVIFNSNGDENLRHHLKCIKKSGRFIDIRDPSLRNFSIGNEDLVYRNITYISIYPEHFFKSEVIISEKIQIAKLIQQGIDDETIIPFMTTPIAQIDKAINFINEKNYIGKVCVEVKPEEFGDEIDVSPASVPSLRRVYFDPKKSYIVLGGFGGFGVELCLFMSRRYTKNIVIISRSGPRTGGHRALIFECKRRGVNVVISKADCSTMSGAEEVINTASKMGPVGGIFNLAAVLKDSLFENMTVADFEQVFKPKVLATKCLDIVSRKLCPDLEYFVTFSSVSCGRGNAGQTNYGMANSVMDRICETRFDDGFPALSIQWGAIGDVGMIFEKMALSNDSVIAGGIVPQKLHSCLGTLDYFLQLPYPVLSTVVLADKLKSVASNVQAGPVGVVANILGIKNIDTVNKSATLVELGTDSLTNVEIKQTLERKFGIMVSAEEVLQLTFLKLEEYSQSL